MKKILLFLLSLSIGVATMAQLSRNAHPRVVRDVPAVAVDIPVMNPLQIANPSVNSKAVLEDDLGQTRYDLQTNESIQNRIYVFPDGTVAGTWTTSTQDASWSDRGSGYNYYDGTSWITPPVTTRLETSRTGWPSIAAWNGNGEIVVAHNTSTNWVTNTRPVKGTGAWTQTTGPAAPTGVMGLGWPRMITNGATHQNVHIIGLSLGTGNPPGAVYKGLDGALLYWRSLDGGATWDKLGVQISGLDSANYSSFSGDEYAWGNPKGDTIYFSVGGPYTDMFIMKSTDNGENWTKIPILSNDLYKKLGTLPATAEIPPWRSSDGAMAVEMDKSGVIHFASGIGGGSVSGGTKYIRLNNNGLIYWNTTMPMLKDSLNLDTLDAHGQLLGYYSDGPNPGDTLKTVTGYRIGLTSFPQISVDEFNNVYVLYSGITWENPNPDNINYRHIFGRAKFHGQATWSTDPIDLNSDFIYVFREFIFTAMAKRIANDKLRVIYQTADQPGTAVGTSTTTAPIPFHDNIIQYREIPGNTFWPVGIDNNAGVNKNNVGQNYPNPVKGMTSFTVNVEKSSKVIVEVSNIMGQKVMFMDKGIVNTGAQKFTLDCNSLTSGIYFYTVKINGESFTHKMIVQ